MRAPKRASVHASLSVMPRLSLVTALLAAPMLGCQTLDAVGEEIEASRDRPVSSEPEEPPLPADPLAAIARLEARGIDREGMLRQLLRRGDETTRVHAANALGRLDVAPTPSSGTTEANTAALCSALDDLSPAVRAASAFALGQRADPAAKAALLDHWMDRDTTVRARIVEAASRIEDAELHDEVLTALQDPAAVVRFEAAIGPHRWPSDSEDAHRIDAILVREARAQGTSARFLAATLFTLQRRKSVEAVPLFLAHATNEDPEVRIFAMKGLANALDATVGKRSFRTESVTAALRNGLTDPDWRIACEAAAGLKLDARQAFNDLERALFHPSVHVRIQAILTLGSRETLLGRPRQAGLGTEVLVKIVQASKTPPVVAAAALEALEGWGGETYFEAESAIVRAGYARALGQTAGQEQAHLDRLVRLSYDENKRVAWFAVESLAAHLPRSRPRLHELCTDADNGLRLAAVVALREDPSMADLPFLTLAFETSKGDISEEVAFNALQTAAKIPRDGALGLLNSGLAHENAYVRSIARRLLRERGWKTPPQTPSSSGSAAPPAGRDVLSHRVAEIVTNRGTMRFELFPDETPRHVENFVKLAESGYYDGLTFHRVVPDFVIQGGDYRGDGNGAQPFHGHALRREFTPRKYVRGSLGMPRNEDPDSGGSQIFVTHRATPHLDGRYTLFGQLTDGFDVLDTIQVGDTIERVVLR